MLDHEDHRAPEVRVAEQRGGDEQFTRPGSIHHVTIMVQETAPWFLPPASARTAAKNSLVWR